jgi:hypothetical protein
MVTSVNNMISSTLETLQNAVVGTKKFISAGVGSLYHSFTRFFTAKQATQQAGIPGALAPGLHTLSTPIEKNEIVIEVLAPAEEKEPEASVQDAKPEAKSKADKAPWADSTQLPRKNKSRHATQNPLHRDRADTQPGIKQADRNNFNQVLLYMDGPEAVRHARKESYYAVAEFLSAYDPNKLSSQAQQEVREVLDQQLDKLAKFNPSEFTRKGTHEQVAELKTKALIELNEALKKLAVKYKLDV